MKKLFYNKPPLDFRFDIKKPETIHHTVTVCINKKQWDFKLAIDTGSYRTIIKKETVMDIFGVLPEDFEIKRKATSATTKEKLYTIKTDWVRIDDLIKHEYSIDCKKLPDELSVAGILGWSFFIGYALFFDFKNGIVTAEQPLEIF